MENQLSLLENAKEGQRNDTLNKCSYSLGQLVGGGELQRECFEKELQKVSRKIGLSEGEIHHTIRSGIEAGIKEPRSAPIDYHMYLNDIDQNNNETPIFPDPMSITGCELYKKEFTPLKWVVQNLIPEGLTILAGAPKIGKSFLVLQIALNVVCNKKVFGKLDAIPGKVIYLALEDSQRRLQSRMYSLIDQDYSIENLENLVLSTDCIPMDEEGVRLIDDCLRKDDCISMIIFDTMTRIQPKTSNRTDEYEKYTRFLGPIHKIALKRRVSIIMVHHTRKGGSEDPLEAVLGSNAISGVADTIMVMTSKKMDEEAELYIKGREIEEQSFKLKRASDSLCWDLPDNVETSSPEQEMIVKVLNKHPNGLSAKEIEEVIGKDASQVSQIIRKRLLPKGIVTRKKHGVYTLPNVPF